jgi:ferrous iron transport protein A
MQTITLTDLSIGEKARVVGFSGQDKLYHHQLMTMGLIRGTEFSVLRRAPLGDPIALLIENTCLCLRQHEALCLLLVRC